VASGSLTGSLTGVGVERGGVGSLLDQLALVEAWAGRRERLDRAVGDQPDDVVAELQLLVGWCVADRAQSRRLGRVGGERLRGVGQVAHQPPGVVVVEDHESCQAGRR